MPEILGKGVVLVTGAASGIGLATAAILLDQGWQVVGLDRDSGAIASAERDLSGHGARLRFVQVDVTDETGIDKIVAETAAHGAIRGLVTSAGVGRDTPLLETTPEQFRSIYDVNVVGTFIVARAVAAAMRRSGGGAIVTVASVSGLVGNIGRSAYGASKGAVVNLTRIMAVELARYGIRVNSVAPGPIDTPLVATLHPAAMREQWHDRVSIDRYGTPAEVGEAIAFLLDPQRASYITGQILAVDGGFLAAGVIDKARG